MFIDIEPLLPLSVVFPFSSNLSFLRFNIAPSVDDVLDEESLAIVGEEDEGDDWDILDSGDLPGLLGRGEAIILSVTRGGTSAGLAPTLAGDEWIV